MTAPCSPRLSPLPIDDVLPSLVAAVRNRSAAVLRAPPGAGKTSRVPPALLHAGLAGDGQVLLLEPRRLAARSAARRIAWEQGWQVGSEVGYQVRFEDRTSRATRIVAMTEGVLIRRLQDDPFLEGVQIILFDEFHERHLDADLALAMVRRIRETVRSDLKLVVMSATLDSEPLARYLGDCGIIESAGRLHPVKVLYDGAHDRRPVPVRTAAAIERLLAMTSGDLLAFLPGVGEIHRTARELEPLTRRHDLLVLPLYGEMSPDAQDAVLQPQPQRKVVLATNVAETSITIDGITGVVDSGLVKRMQFDPRVGLDRLELGPISRASADQRAGRAGRVQPGVCLRLWAENTHRQRREFEQPEILRVDLSSAVLQLRCWGETDVAAFPWFEPPSAEQIASAHVLLRRLGAIDDDGVTGIGRRMACLPVHPRLARLMLAGLEFGIPERAALAAALLSERDPFRIPQIPQLAPGDRHAHPSHSDVVDRVAALAEFEASGRHDSPFGDIQTHAARTILRARDQLLRLLRPKPAAKPETDGGPDAALRRALLAAFPDRLSRRREPGSRRGVMVGGRGVRLAPASSVTRGDLFLCVDVDDSGAEALVRQASAVEREWLPPERLHTAIELFFHPSQRQVQARRRTYWEDLLLEESPTAVPETPEAAQLLFDAAAAQWERVFPVDDAEVAGFVTRVECLRGWRPELELPPLDRTRLNEVLRQLCVGRRSFDELRRAPWLSALKSLLTAEQLVAIEREAPERIAVPSGSRIRLIYEFGRPPVLAVRIQEIFGMRATPRVAGGRVPVLLHLLGPNMRPQQVTDDLESFWSTTYARIRGELRRRYPKHAWPEDPLTAAPTRGAKSRG